METSVKDYIISGGEQGKARLNVLSEVLQPYTKDLFDKLGISAGMSFLDLGCGGGNVSLMAAAMTGSTGRVEGVDFDEQIISLARKDAEEAGIQNVSFKAMSVYDIAYENEFDVAYARFLLSHLKEPKEVLQKMLRSVKPGGRVIVEDVEFWGHFCHPASAVFNKYVYLYVMAAKNKGADATIGQCLFSMFTEAGISDAGFDLIQPAFSKGPGKWMAWLTLDKIKDTLVAERMVTAQSVDKLLKKLEDLTNDEQTIMSLPRIFRVWGTKK